MTDEHRSNRSFTANPENGLATEGRESVGKQDYATTSLINDVANILHIITGEDFTQEHLKETPRRFVEMMEDLTTRDRFEFTVFANESNIDEMVLVEDIPFYTLCAHHLLPFYGKAHVAYIPDFKLAGLSKITRTVQAMSKGLWTQEELTNEVVRFLAQILEPKGAAVVMKGEHMCMSMRGVQTPGTITTTSAMRGVFLQQGNGARQEFLQLINGGK